MKTPLLLFLLAFALQSCIKNNPDPAWLEVKEWSLLANPNSINPTGVLTENISDAWVYVDNKLMGVFEVPFKIPILMEGERTVTIYPTVLNNGISATKKIYPFLQPFETTVNLVKNETVTLEPTTQYFDNVNFWIEDFEDATFDIVDGPAATTPLLRVNDPAVLNPEINGGFFGRVSLSTATNFWSASTIANNNTLQMNLPKGAEVYLEIDYHVTNRLLTGVLAISSTGDVKDNPNVQINPQDPSEVQWKKMYIDLRDIVSGSTNASYYELSFQSLLDEGDATGEVNIDNIKAVHF